MQVFAINSNLTFSHMNKYLSPICQVQFNITSLCHNNGVIVETRHQAAHKFRTWLMWFQKVATFITKMMVVTDNFCYADKVFSFS